MRPVILLFVCCLAVSVAGAADDSEVQSRRQINAAVARIDRLFAEAWQREQVVPAELAGDDEFLRRCYLDLAGRIPSVAEARSFLQPTESDALKPENLAARRAELVSELIDSAAFVRNFTTVWRTALIPQASAQAEFRATIPGFEAWLWEQFSRNRSYDDIVRDLITAPLNDGNAAALATTTSPDAFFVVRELKPENLAAGTSRAFLGLRLDCAECHDHPFDRWKQQQFWQLAAFYSGFSRSADDEDTPAMQMVRREDRSARSITIPGTQQVVEATFLNAESLPDVPSTEPADAEVSARQELADWVVSPGNPWFAKMAVNRLWAQFFGRGLVDPIDDFSDANPPSHPEVLQLLADELVHADFDLRRIVKIITATRAYQLSSRQSHPSQADSVHFARAVLRGLTPEQLFDSLAEAVGYYQPYRSDNPFVIDTQSPRAMFLDLFRDNSESALERETTILQALAMMNGEFVDNATSLAESRTLRAIVEFPAISETEKLNTLFLATLTRLPEPSEVSAYTDYRSQLEEATSGSSQALSDMFWALLNSSEFLLNH
ncbi:MAG: DUF1553 domain-containing protein [Planctomycetaceae bacterium]